MASDEALLIFARYPRLGRVKTRLRSRYDDSQILALHRAFLLDTLEWTAPLKVRRFLFLADCTPEESDLLAASDSLFAAVELRVQRGGDLGERMWNAYRTARPGARRLVFLGSDTPALAPQTVRAGFDQLRRHPVVIGPSSDGGYYLLGLAEPRPELFQDIPWGTSRVLQETVGRLRRPEYRLLPLCSDIDTPEDLERLEREWPVSAAPRTRRALAEFQTMGAPKRGKLKEAR